MGSQFLVYMLGFVLMVLIYYVVKLTVGRRHEVSYHFVERIFVFGLAVVLIALVLFYS